MSVLVRCMCLVTHVYTLYTVSGCAAKALFMYSTAVCFVRCIQFVDLCIYDLSFSSVSILSSVYILFKAATNNYCYRMLKSERYFGIS